MKKRKRASSRWRTAADLDPGLLAAIMACNGRMYELADRLGITPQAISYWDKIPLSRVKQVERVTKVNRRILRPDMFEEGEPEARRRKAVS